MNNTASLFSHFVGYLFSAAVFCGTVGFVTSAAAAEYGFPVIAHITFNIGLIAIVVLLGFGVAALIGAAWQRLRR